MHRPPERWGDRLAIGLRRGTAVVTFYILSRESVDAVHLQGLRVYGAIACIGHNLAWGDRMYGKNVSGRGTASAYRQINGFTRKLGLAVPRWLMNDRMSEAIACIVKAIAFELQLDEATDGVFLVPTGDPWERGEQGDICLYLKKPAMVQTISKPLTLSEFLIFPEP